MIDVTDQVIEKVGQSDRLPAWWPRLVGTGCVPEPPPLTWPILAKLAGLLVVWRSTILLFSYLWGRLGVVPHWQPQWVNMWLWRYSIGWDAGWFLSIAEKGYWMQNGVPPAIPWFPLYPLLTRGLHTLIPGKSDVFAALIISHLALAVAVVYIYQIVRLTHSETVAWRTLAFLLVFPSAFFFSAVYSEPMLLLGFAGTLYHARRGQWVRAGLFAGAASATKLIGIVAIGPLVLELLAQTAWRQRLIRPLAGLALAPLGLIAYFSYLQLHFGDVGVFFRVKADFWQKPFHPVFQMGFQRLLGDKSADIFYPANITRIKTAFLLFDTTSLWLCLIAGIICWWKLRPSYGALVLGGIFMAGLSGSPASMNRYVVVLFPAFMLLGMLKSEALRSAVMITSAFGLAFVTWLFINGYWAG